MTPVQRGCRAYYVEQRRRTKVFFDASTRWRAVGNVENGEHIDEKQSTFVSIMLEEVPTISGGGSESSSLPLFPSVCFYIETGKGFRGQTRFFGFIVDKGRCNQIENKH